MNDKFKLYAGIERNDKWFNVASLDHLKGGVIALLDSDDRSTVGRMRTLIERCLSVLHDEDGNEHKMEKADYGDLCMDDGWKILLELQKQFLNQKYPEFTESFFCFNCSKQGLERYTTVKESWHKLIEDGIIDEIYHEDSDRGVEIQLPIGMEIEIKGVTQGVYKDIVMEPITIAEMQKLVKIQTLTENEGLMLCAIWDTRIKEIKGLTQRELNILKRNPRDAFTRKYLVSKEDVEALSSDDRLSIGMQPQYRTVSCDYCYTEIGGGLDFTNFFDFIVPKKSSQRDMRKHGV